MWDREIQVAMDPILVRIADSLHRERPYPIINPQRYLLPGLAPVNALRRVLVQDPPPRPTRLRETRVERLPGFLRRFPALHGVLIRSWRIDHMGNVYRYWRETPPSK